MKLILKSTIIKIKKSFGRFFSVLLIVALGMGFFAGVRETTPMMLETIENYYDKHNLMDIKIVSTFGLTESDIESLKQLKYIDKVIPSYSVDVLINGNPTRIHALESEINNVTLIKGKMPKENECLGDKDIFKLNEKLTFKNENLNITSCTVSGLIDSVLYLNQEKGISSVGNGKLNAYIFINKDSFNYEVYTDVYLTAENTLKDYAYTDNYNKHYDLLYDELLTLKPIREAIRYEEILTEATKEINKIQNEVDKETSAAKNKLDKAKKELDDNKKLVENGKLEISNNRKLLNEKLETNLKLITDGKKQVNDNLLIINNTLTNLGLNNETLNKQINDLKTNINNLKILNESLDQTSIEYQSNLATINVLVTNLNNLIELQTNKNTLEKKLIELDNNETTLKTEINNGLKKIDEEESKLLNNELELNDGYVEYNDGLEKLNQEKRKADDKIKEAKDELKTIEEPIWYLFNRKDNNGYINFYDDASIIEKIAGLFPIFFILIVALMTLNTISRLIEEERTEIGIYKALGYTNFKIMVGYLFYVLVATIVGIAFGLSIGYTLVPSAIYSIFKANYILPSLLIAVKPIPLTIMLITAFILLIGVTIYGTSKELNNVTAELLRPKAPKDGKKVLLEKFKIFWKRLSFTWKVTVRNIFRYKKRIIMTVIGVAGSTALLITGFGLKDSIETVSDLQFKETIKYNTMIILDKNNHGVDEDLNTILNTNNINDYLLVNQEGFTFKTNENKNTSVTLIVPEDKDNINTYVSLKDINTKKEVNIPNHGVIITKRMAELLDVKIDDNIKIRNNINKLFVVQVKGIVENYLGNYVYISNDYYKIVFEKSANLNTILTNTNDVDTNELSTSLLKNDQVNAINYIKDNIRVLEKIISGLNKIVLLIIAAAAALAFIILFNLTSINVNERVREIATLKVLGFDDNEINTYVYRETLILTFIGIALGLGLGILLHKFIIVTAEPDGMVFIKDIKFLSYIYSTAASILFLYIVRMFTHFKLQKIDMIESLKSAE